MADKKRKSNIELLRIVSMLLIILGHDIMASGLPLDVGMQEEMITNFNLLICRTFFNAGHWGATIFFLITGYFIKSKNIRWHALMYILIIVAFYYILFICLGYLFPEILTEPSSYDLKTVMSHGYWFITAYVLMNLIFPKLLMVTSENQLLIATAFLGIGLYIYYCTYEITELVYLVFAPMYFMLLGHFLNNIKDLLTLPKIIIITIVAFIAILGINYVQFSEEASLYKTASIINPLNNLIAILFVLIFIKIPEFSSIVVDRVATLILSIYLIHTNPYINLLIWQKLFTKPDMIPSPFLILCILLEVVTIFSICGLVELLRKKLTKHFLSK